MYSARVAPAQYAFQKADDEDVKLGRLAPDRLYVLGDNCAPFSLTSVHRLDGVMIVPPAGADLRGLSLEPVRAPVVRLNDQVAFSKPENRCLLGAGWVAPQGAGVSSDGPEAALYLPVAAGETGPLLLSVQISGLSGGAFAMEAAIGGEILAPQKGPAPDTATFLISAKTVKDRRVLPISLRSTTGSPGPGKAPNGPVFQMVSARLDRLPGAQ
jgi:hypothetical protein